MSDVITRFKLETTQYDSKLRDASKGLAEYTRLATLAGNEFGKFTQKNVEAARALGTITPSANNAKDKVKELVTAFNDAAKAYNALTKEQQQTDFGKAMAQSIGQLSQKIREAKSELYDLDKAAKDVHSGGLFGGGKIDGMLQVFGGNVMTKIAGMGVGLANEMADAVKQGIELAKAGEGVRIAFERIGRGDILDGLRQATHGTVTDLELMKAAVKFNDFKLPLDQLGTMLAFAQKKAKDTGQSIDYMVDSIVTGLGRKSLMILDNLGLSASEIRDKMAETGDMTKAVGEIIREQMSKSGEYIETAADKAAQADVRLKNAMEELGRTFQPISAAGASMWSDLKVGAVELLNDAVLPLIAAMKYLGLLKEQNMPDEGYKPDTSHYSQNTGVLGSYVETTDSSGRVIKAQHYDGQVSDSQLAEYNAALRKMFSGGGGKGGKNTPTYAADSIAAMEASVSALTKAWKEAGDGVRDYYLVELIAAESKLKKLRDSQELLKMQLREGQSGAPTTTGLGGSDFRGFAAASIDVGAGLTPEALEAANAWVKAGNDSTKAWTAAASAVQGVGSALGNIEDPAAKIMSTIAMAIANVAMAYTETLAKDKTSKSNIWLFIATAAAAMTSMISTISSIHSATGYAQGGEIKGNSYSGDNIPIMANAGEIVLNKAQQATLASSIQQNGGGGSRVVGILKGEDIVLMADRWGMRTGRGELLFGKNL